MKYILILFVLVGCSRAPREKSFSEQLQCLDLKVKLLEFGVSLIDASDQYFKENYPKYKEMKIAIEKECSK